MLEAKLYTSKEQLITQNPKNFCQGVGKLEKKVDTTYASIKMSFPFNTVHGVYQLH